MTTPTIHQPSDFFWETGAKIQPGLTPTDAHKIIDAIAAANGCTAQVMTPADLAGEAGPAWDAAVVQAGEDDPRTPEQRAFDDFAKEVLDTRDSDRPY